MTDDIKTCRTKKKGRKKNVKIKRDASVVKPFPEPVQRSTNQRREANQKKKGQSRKESVDRKRERRSKKESE